MQSNQNIFFFVWVLTHAPNVGKELPVNTSEQDWAAAQIIDQQTAISTQLTC
jgi:hypothetical protein